MCPYDSIQNNQQILPNTRYLNTHNIYEKRIIFKQNFKHNIYTYVCKHPAAYEVWIIHVDVINKKKISSTSFTVYSLNKIK